MSALRAALNVCRASWLLPAFALASLAVIDVSALRNNAAAVRSSFEPSKATSLTAHKSSLEAPAQSWATKAPVARLEFSTAKLDLGDGKPNEILRGKLTLRNRGERAVEFSLVKHCGCTELEPMSGELAAGATKTIRVGVQLPGHANSEKSTSVEVQAGDPMSVVDSCVLCARCPAPFAVTPAFVDFGQLGVEELSEATAELR